MWQPGGIQVPALLSSLPQMESCSVALGRVLTLGLALQDLCLRICPAHLPSASAQFCSFSAMCALRAENDSWEWSLAGWHPLIRCRGSLGGVCSVGAWGHHLHFVGLSLGLEPSNCGNHNVLRDGGGSQKVTHLCVPRPGQDSGPTWDPSLQVWSVQLTRLEL